MVSTCLKPCPQARRKPTESSCLGTPFSLWTTSPLPEPPQAPRYKGQGRVSSPGEANPSALSACFLTYSVRAKKRPSYSHHQHATRGQAPGPHVNGALHTAQMPAIRTVFLWEAECPLASTKTSHSANTTLRIASTRTTKIGGASRGPITCLISSTPHNVPRRQGWLLPSEARNILGGKTMGGINGKSPGPCDYRTGILRLL